MVGVQRRIAACCLAGALIIVCGPAAGEIVDGIGLYYDTAATEVCDISAIGAPVDVYLILSNPSETTAVTAWEGSVSLDAGIVLNRTVLHGGAFNLTVPPNFVVGLMSPLPAQPLVVLATLQITAAVGGGLYIGPATSASLPGTTTPGYLGTDRPGTVIETQRVYGSLDEPSLTAGPVACPGGAGDCPGGEVFPDCREITAAGILFAERYSVDADALFAAPLGVPCFYDSTQVTVTRGPGSRFFISGAPDALADWICDDRLYLAGQYLAPVGFDGIIDGSFPICAPMPEIVGPVPPREITDFIPMGTNCLEFKLADTQREILGNSAIYLVMDLSIRTEATSWGRIRSLYR